MLVRITLAFVLGLIIVPIVGWCYFRFGYAPVATSSSPMPFEKRLANMALNQWVRQEAPKNAPIEPSDANYKAGAHIYRENCAMCHGLPEQEATPTSKGIYPKPPQLFKGHGVTDDPAGETYWKVANGIRLTGMPAYKNSLTQDQIWQVSLLLANADKLSQAVRGDLEQP